MAVADEIRAYLANEVRAKVGDKGQSGDAKLIIAEQKSFLSKKTVEYSVKFKVEDGDRTVRFFEMLKESGSGMPAGVRLRENPNWGSSDSGAAWLPVRVSADRKGALSFLACRATREVTVGRGGDLGPKPPH